MLSRRACTPLSSIARRSSSGARRNRHKRDPGRLSSTLESPRGARNDGHGVLVRPTIFSARRCWETSSRKASRSSAGPAQSSRLIAFVVSTGRLLAHRRPVAGGIVIPPQPGERNEIDLLIFGQRIDEGRHFAPSFINLNHSSAGPAQNRKDQIHFADQRRHERRPRMARPHYSTYPHLDK